MGFPGAFTDVSTSTPDWKKIRERAGPYPPQAYQFVREGLAHTVKMFHGGSDGRGVEGEGDALCEPAGEPTEESRHVSGQQLCLGLKDFALRQYGLLTRTVLSHWGVRQTQDFGRIVFAMVEGGWMRKTDDDSLADFTGMYEFDEAFGTLEASRPSEA